MTKYHALGQLIEKLRLDAGIAQQLELAKLIGSTQQSVSRWELGVSRPRAKQLGALAAALKCDVQPLLEAAGYIPESTTSSFAQPFPLHALSPENFERFCHQLLSGLYPEARVHRMGGPGHAQGGADLELRLRGGQILSFQCKRHSAFGAAKLQAAIRAHRSRANRKFLLLSGVASPAVRAAAGRRRDWDVWDVEDLSQKVRTELSVEAQRRLADTFFPGQRFALLGVHEPGPWQTREEFFLPFEIPDAIFCHSWTLVGRDRELEILLESLKSPKHRLTYVVGKGGGGKTRLLKAALDRFVDNHPNTTVWLLSPSAELTQRSLEDLGADPKILVVDDAHERQDLRLLFQHAAASKGKTKLLLLLRPYGLEFVKSQAVPFGLFGEDAQEVQLADWTLMDATALAAEVLSDTAKGLKHLAEHIARLTADCPLATVVGAFLVAKKKVNPELVSQERGFRDALLGKFREVIAGEIGSRSDADSVRRLLKLVALLQPVYPEDPRFKELVSAVEQLKPAASSQLFRLLADAGVLLKRAGRYRVSPDLLADFILEEACVGVSQTSTGYAEEVFDQCDPVHLEHLLLNLGKLDWRLANGQASSSTLLDGVWSRLRVTETYDDPAVKAVAAVAFYQPARALDFLESVIRAGTRINGLSAIARHAAYNRNHLERACALLWELGRNDRRPLNQHPGHPIRVLAEMCAVEPNKPVEFNEMIVDFLLSLTQHDEAWNGHYTPFDVLAGILHTEGHTTQATDVTVSFKPFLVRRDAVAPLRSKVVDRTVDLLSSDNPLASALAARFLQQAVRFPMGVFNSPVPDGVRSAWELEFTETLDDISGAVTKQSLRSVVLVEIARAVSWHAAFPTGPTNEAARRIIAALPTTLRFRTTLALVDGYGQIFSGRDFEAARERIQKFLSDVVEDLVREYQDGEQLREFLEMCLREIADASIKPQESASQILLSMLVDRSDSFAQAVVNNSYRTPTSLTAQCAAAALAKVMSADYEAGIVRVEEYLRSTERSLVLAAARAYSLFRPTSQEYTDRDVAVLRTSLMMSDTFVVRMAIHSLLQVGSIQPRLAVILLYVVDLTAGSDVADDVFMGLRIRSKPEASDRSRSQGSDSAYAQLTEADIHHFLQRLTRAEQLDGYWTQTFLAFVSQRYPLACLEFLFERLDFAVENPDGLGSFRPFNHGPWADVPLKFRESREFGVVVRQVMRCISKMENEAPGNPVVALYAGELFEAVCAPIDGELVGYLDTWIDCTTASELPLIAQVLSHAPNNFVFDQREFVARFLQKAQAFGPQTLDDAVGALVSSAVSGVKGGTPGQPFPRDIELRDGSEKAMKEVPRLSPSYMLYERLKKIADENIALTVRQREFMTA